MGQGKRRIEFNGPMEVIDSRVKIFRSRRVIDITGQTISSAQVLTISHRIPRCLLLEGTLFVSAQLQTQFGNDLFRNKVLQRNDVFGSSVDTVTPENVTGRNVE